MADLIISFDSEDYLTPAADDAERWWAEQLHERGMRGSFQVVGELVRALRRRGRDDVIAAIARHEVGYHSDLHSAHPTHPELVDGLDLATGITRIVRHEAQGLAEVAAAFGRWPLSYCSPGDSWTPATLLVMARMGLRVYCNGRMQEHLRGPHWYAGMLVVGYDLDLLEGAEDGADQAGFRQRIEGLISAAGTDGVVVLYTHPCRTVTAAFWDRPFFAGRSPPLADAPPAPLRPAAEIRRIQDRCRGHLDWLARHPRLRGIDFATCHGERAAPWRDLDALRAEHGLQVGEEGRLPLRASGADACLPSAAFATMRYGWPIYPPGFTGERLIAQAGGLAWSAAPAARRG